MGLSTALEADVHSAPQRIRDIVATNFATMGWDIVHRRVLDQALFTAPHLVSCLDEIIGEIANYEPIVTPTAAELADLSDATHKLWDLDHHRLVPGKDYQLALQHGKGSWDAGDVAADPLFSFVDQRCLEKPTFQAFMALLDNYSAATGIAEVSRISKHQHQTLIKAAGL